jgi:NifB/MoaA-like Fe-S oxidoreductase
MFAFRRTVIHRRAIVTLLTGRAFEGVIFAKRGPLLVLRDAAMLEGGRRVPLDGEVVVERARVEFMQVAAPVALTMGEA